MLQQVYFEAAVHYFSITTRVFTQMLQQSKRCYYNNENKYITPMI